MKEKQLEIKVLDNEVLHKFHVTIDREFIGKQDVLFTSLFESPEDVFIYLTENFSQVVVDKGVLIFRYTVGKKHQVKDIELAREEVEESVLFHLKIAKIEEHFTAQLRHKEDRIAALQQGLRELVSQFKEYKKESRLKMERTEENLQEEQIYSKGLEGKIKIQENIIKILEERMQRDEKIARDILEKMEMQEKSSKSIEEMLSRQEKSSKSTEERLQKAGNIAGQLIESIPKAISHHPNNNHQQYYALTNCTATSSRLALVAGAGNGKWYNFVNRTEVLPKQHNKYTVRIVKAACSDLMIGFCTEKGLGVSWNFDKDESVYYYCHSNGYLYENGHHKDLAGCGSKEGDLVECVLYLLEWRVCWSKGGKVLAECAVPASMKGRPIYFSISQYFEGDAVEVSSA